MNKLKHKRKGIVYLSIASVTALLNIAARCSTAFSDGFITFILPVIVNTYGRLMNLIPIPLGEILIGAGVVMVILAILAGPLLPAAILAKRGQMKKRIIGYYKFFAWILLFVCFIMTTNSLIMYHGSTFSEMYFTEQDVEYTMEDLIAARNFVVEQCNQLYQEMERDEAGNIIYTKDMEQEAINSMQMLGETYERLSGYYPRAKALLFSDFCSQQYIQGYFFPFTMEANYNDVMYIMNMPATMCHELAHMHGYILEDEANLIGFLACVESDDIFFQYSGYLSVLYYLDNDFYHSVGSNYEVYRAEPAINDQVHEDNIFLAQEEWDRIDSKALFETEVVDAVSDNIMNAALKANGVTDGMVSYSRVVGLVLQYYAQNGYPETIR